MSTHFNAAMVRTILALTATAGAMGSVHASVVTTSRSAFESSITITYKETFQSLTGTTVVTGPLTMATGLVVSSPSNNLFSVGPGQSSNPTEAIGSNSPASDSLNFALGGAFAAFGVDLFQNHGGGSQGTVADTFRISFFDGSTLIDTQDTSVAPNGGSFFGYVSSLGSFDKVTLQGLGSNPSIYEVADNVTVGNGSTVPEPASILLVGMAVLCAGASTRMRSQQK